MLYLSKRKIFRRTSYLRCLAPTPTQFFLGVTASGPQLLGDTGGNFTEGILQRISEGREPPERLRQQRHNYSREIED